MHRRRAYRSFIAGLFLWAAGGGGWSEGTPPSAVEGPGDVAFIDDAPAGGYRRLAEAIQTEAIGRDNDPEGVDFAPTARPFTGDRAVPVLCVTFRGAVPAFQPKEYEELLFESVDAPRPSPPKATLTQYYRDMSLGKLTPRGQVFGWYVLPHDDAFYEQRAGQRYLHMGELLDSAFDQAIKDGVDFGKYDNDGPDGNPNSGDDDGLVDAVFLIHPETGNECDGTGAHIHSHRGQYSLSWSPSRSPYVTNIERPLNSRGQLTGDKRFIRIEDYTIQPGLSCTSTSSKPVKVEIGVFCHEYGHALMLPDLYDRNKTSNGLGRWCLMSAGNQGAPLNGNAEHPVHMSAWCKARLGWANVVNVQKSGTITFEPVEANNQIYCIDVPKSGGQEYFLLEYRDASWSGSGHLNWDRFIPQSGIAIWHVDETVGASGGHHLGWPFAKRGFGQNDFPSIPDPATGAFGSHALVALIQADGDMHLESKTNLGDEGDLFVDNVGFDDAMVKASLRSYNHGATGISIEFRDDLRTAVVTIEPPSSSAAGAVADAGVPPIAEVEEAPAVETAAPDAAVSPAEIAEDTNRRVSAILGELTQRFAERMTDRQSNSPEYAWSDRFSERTWQGASDGSSLLDFSQLSPGDWNLLETTGEAQLYQRLPPDLVQESLRRYGESRTFEVEKGRTYGGFLGHAEAFLQASNLPAATIRVSPQNDAVRSIANIEIPAKLPEVGADAQRLIAGDLRELIGRGAQLTLVQEPEADSKTGTVWFEQLIDADERKIPLYRGGVTLSYDDGNVVGVRSNVFSTENIEVKGKPPEAPFEQRRDELAKRLNVHPERLSDAGECVYFVAGNPAAARIGAKYELSVGEYQEPLDVLVDGETGDFVSAE